MCGWAEAPALRPGVERDELLGGESAQDVQARARHELARGLAPAKQAQEVYDKVSGELDEQLARLESAVGNQIAAFNKAIDEANLKPVG